MNKNEVINIEQEHYFPVFSRLPLVLTHGDGCWVYDVDGNKYLDFLAGIAVLSVGYGNKILAKAIGEQAEKLIHCSNLFYTQPQSLLVKNLVDVSGFDRVFLCNSGAEANEGAIKFARKYAYKNYKNKYKIISTNHSFHGRTLTTLTATGNIKYQEGYAPLPEGFLHVDYGDIKALEKVMDDEVCAVILEPVQGEGGVNVPPEGYLKKVRELCDKYSAILIFDEVQTGMGRTGKWFAFEHDLIKPDIVTMAKGIGGGFPLGAVLTTENIAKHFSPGDHGSTFGGNALSCAAANAVFTIFKEEDVISNVEELGHYFMTELKKLQNKYPSDIKAVRGKGLLLGVELNYDGQNFVNKCLDNKLILNCTAGNVIRIVPPLTVKKEEIDFAILVMDKVFMNNKNI